MCTELFLVIIYFITLAFCNYFLFKLLKNLLKKIIFLFKIKTIFKFFSKKELNMIGFFYFSQKSNAFSYLNNFKLIWLENQKKDVLTVGNIYKYLLLRIEKQEKSANYFLKLLENQYLSFY
jgi:hypothetical protein